MNNSLLGSEEEDQEEEDIDDLVNANRHFVDKPVAEAVAVESPEGVDDSASKGSSDNSPRVSNEHILNICRITIQRHYIGKVWG